MAKKGVLTQRLILFLKENPDSKAVKIHEEINSGRSLGETSRRLTYLKIRGFVTNQNGLWRLVDKAEEYNDLIRFVTENKSDKSKVLGFLEGLIYSKRLSREIFEIIKILY